MVIVVLDTQLEQMLNNYCNAHILVLETIVRNYGRPYNLNKSDRRRGRVMRAKVRSACVEANSALGVS